jgi:hypothetical protein
VTTPRASRERRARRPAGRTRSGWTAIGVPIDSVGRAGGTEHAPAAVREHGLLERLEAARGVGRRRRRRERTVDLLAGALSGS